MVDLNKYPEGLDEIIKHMDFMPEDENARRGLVAAFMFNAFFY